MKMKIQQSKSMGYSESNSKRVVIQAYLRKPANKQNLKKPNHAFKETGKRRINKPKVSKRKEVIKTSAEIDKIETKNNIKDE